MSNFIINNNHPIIQREQTYFLDRKLISIHSIDRDINKWPNSNNFEIDLPNTLNNVYSIRLLDLNIPNFNYTFSSNYQNTKFSLKLQQDISGGGSEAILIDNYYINNFSTIQIEEGYYTPEELAIELENKLNNQISNDININYDKFKVKYDNIKNKIFIINTRDNFTLYFNKQEIYNLDCGQKIVWNQYANWGLPYNLGYEKQIYQNLNTQSGENLIFTYDNTIFTPDPSNESVNIKFSNSINYIDILGYDSIYMELDKYNSIDEITPYSRQTNNIYNNDYTGSVNSAFAKIPLTKEPFNRSIIKNSFLNNITFFKVPITTIKKLKFRFRFHDGVLVDFKNVPFSFTLEINQLIDEQHRSYSLNIPYVFSI
jgi:hypothetical protein